MNSWLSLLPPILAIVLAFLTRKVVLALALGLLSGVIVLHGTNITAYSVILDPYLLDSFRSRDSLYIIFFSLFIAGSVSILHLNGGMDTLLKPFLRTIKTRKRAQWITFFSGLILFFDDYANSLVVGNTMRSVTDRYNISREKLAYLVDSTSAPVAAIALVTTWIGAEIGYIQEASSELDIQESAYSIFLNSIPFAFYPILTLVFIGILCATGKDFGPMLLAEKKALKEQKFAYSNNDERTSVPFWYGATPILALLITTFTTLLITGKTNERQGLGDILGNADCYSALLYGSSVALLLSFIFSMILTQKSFFDLGKDMMKGFKNLVPALLILVFSWALGSVISDLGTADYIIAQLPSSFPSWTLPAIIFLLSAIVSFATGSSWGTMAIVYPLAIPLAFSMVVGEYDLLYASVASVLAGSVFGDHCSPISDTTILSSLASDCNHIQHVKTQLPYALVVGAASCICLVISSFVSPVVCLFGMATILYLLVQKTGKSI